MAYKLDLHTHSSASYDGGITAEQYRKALDSGVLDAIAITDHGRTDLAEQLHSELGDKIIVGEEIMTTDGEIIGLFLKQTIMPGQTPVEVIRQIKQQEGFVYVPHPFETVRNGLHPATMEEFLEEIDIIEVCNGRAFFQNRSEQAVVWAHLNRKVGAASSDAHGPRGLGRTYTSLSAMPERNNFIKVMASAIPVTDRPGLRALMYPKYHRLRKKIRRK